MIINVLIFNFSTNEESSNTSKFLQPLINGMKLQGANIEHYYTQRMNIEKCKACTEDPNFMSNGECNIVDDMKYLYPKMRQADIWIFATPNHPNVINSNFSKFLDRLEPLFEPFAEIKNGNQLKTKPRGKVLLVSTSNDFEFSTFNLLIDHVESFTLLLNREFIGSLLRPHYWVRNLNSFMTNKIKSLEQNLFKAGEELVTDGKLSKELIKEINVELISAKSFLASYNPELA